MKIAINQRLRLVCAAAVLTLGGVMLHGAAKAKKPGAHHKHPKTECRDCKHGSDKIVVAYVTGWSEGLPDPSLMTHINYAFGHVAPSFDSVYIKPDQRQRLEDVVALRKQNPDLKIMLSVGGWGSGNFSEMAADPKLRQKFAASCLRTVQKYGLDGIDIDWEYPTNGAGAGISYSPDDTANYTLLMHDLRTVLGPNRLLTLAGVWNARYIDFPAIMPYVDFVNIMSYDMAPASSGFPHNALYASPKAGDRTVDAALKAHLAAGVPLDKLVVGLPFYGRGVDPYPDYMDYKDYKVMPGTKAVWDDQAKSTYMVDEKTGKVLMGFETPRSMAEKLHFVKRSGARGAMYWEYVAGGHAIAKQVADSILNK